MGINRLLIDSQIRTTTGWDREEGRRTRCPPGHGRQPAAAACAVA